ncbi:hypothetical protein [uncultured Tenacibaculum sp.]|uniref:hypothetical protein n=1 Tax=uncultured Tenacibaculum sp. TaxID=174713 RepID=UPI0026322B8A|nr:hypothetical protein [uncultured Tenacibaculum sp.]
MKRVKFKFTYLLVAFVLSFSFSCNSEDGMDGIDGAQGPQGEQGLPGADGNANVLVKTVDNVVWTEGSYLGQEANFFEIDDMDLTQDVFSSSLILIYFQLFGDEIWYPMTYNFPFDNGNDEVITFTYELNKITIYALSSTGSLNADITKVRYFIIEGNPATSSREDLSKLSYEEAVKRFKIED